MQSLASTGWVCEGFPEDDLHGGMSAAGGVVNPSYIYPKSALRIPCYVTVIPYDNDIYYFIF